jgi:hypothetical protein
MSTDIDLFINTVHQQVLQKAQRGLEKFGKDWKYEAQKAAPLGSTGLLKRSLDVEPGKDGLGLRLTAAAPGGNRYAYKQAHQAFTHVPPSQIGKRGFQSFATISGSPEERYWQGMAMAIARNQAQRYLHDYPQIAFEKAGGIARMTKSIQEG